MKWKWTAPLLAFALTTNPVAAQASRAMPPVSTESRMSGESNTMAWVLLAAILAWATYLVIDNENDDDNKPASP